MLCCTRNFGHFGAAEGKDAHADVVVMDEFHYYSDRDRGVAWQLPLLTLPDSRFLLDERRRWASRILRGGAGRAPGRPRAWCARGSAGPARLRVQRDPLEETIQRLVGAGKPDLHLEHFSQRPPWRRRRI